MNSQAARDRRRMAHDIGEILGAAQAATAAAGEIAAARGDFRRKRFRNPHCDLDAFEQIANLNVFDING